jgi:hypothetical protein
MAVAIGGDEAVSLVNEHRSKLIARWDPATSPTSAPRSASPKSPRTVAPKRRCSSLESGRLHRSRVHPRSGRTAGVSSDDAVAPASAGRSRSTRTSPRRCCGSSNSRVRSEAIDTLAPSEGTSVWKTREMCGDRRIGCAGDWDPSSASVDPLGRLGQRGPMCSVRLVASAVAPSASVSTTRAG